MTLKHSFVNQNSQSYQLLDYQDKLVNNTIAILSLHSLSIVPQLLLDLAVLGRVRRLSVPLPVLQRSLPRGSASSVQHGGSVLDPLLIEELFLVSRLPVVHRLAVLHPVHVVAVLLVTSSLDKL